MPSLAKALDAVGDASLRSVLLFVRSMPDRQSADDVAASLGIHRNVARSRLERLLHAGLLDVAHERRTGRTGPGSGRPAKLYGPAPELQAIEFPPRHYEALVADLVEHLDPATRLESLEAVGLSFGRTLAESSRLGRFTTLPEAAQAACGALRRLGFQASVASSGPADAVLATPNCPLRPLVQRSDGAVVIDQGLWAGLISAALDLDGSSVSCEPGGCRADEPCLVHVRMGRS